MARRRWRPPPWRAVVLWSGALAMVLWGAPLRAEESSAAPKPIPGGLGRTAGAPEGVGAHVFPPLILPTGTMVTEGLTITDFHGAVAIADLKGTGEATDTRTGIKYPAGYELDMRLFKGRYVGSDGVERDGFFGFI
jgi:hypothetical protein